jgi:hypothetical protein
VASEATAGDVFDSFDAGLLLVLTRLRGVLAAQESRTRP